MSPVQLRMYRAEWSKALAAMRCHGRGLSASEAEAERMAIHEEVCGVPCSSKDLRNEDLDIVLARFLAWSRAGDLMAQIRQAEQPSTRCRYLVDDLLDRISAILLETEMANKAVHRGPGREGYLKALATRLAKREFLVSLDDLSVREWQPIIAALVIRLDQVIRQAERGATGRPAARTANKGAGRRYQLDRPGSKAPKASEISPDNCPF